MSEIYVKLVVIFSEELAAFRASCHQTEQPFQPEPHSMAIAAPFCLGQLRLDKCFLNTNNYASERNYCSQQTLPTKCPTTHTR